LSAINNVGIDELKNYLPGKITAFAGQSGAGKSTTLNTIYGNNLMETGSVSVKTERGKHTTRHAELFEYNEGFIVDSPGFSSYEIDNIELLELNGLYPEFSEYIGHCRFKECAHIKEPDCAVKRAVEAGIIDIGRYNRYLEFAEVLNDRRINKYKGKKNGGQ
jgi:ribosome biogenesis GTPase